MADSVNNNTDYDSRPAGDGFQGDGLVNYEEYRGFRIAGANAADHIRTNYLQKDIFIRNRNNLPLGLYSRVSELDVHEIADSHYVSDEIRVVNSNFNSQMHETNQKGIRLFRFEFAREVRMFRNTELEGLLGVAVSTTNNPSRPNEQEAALVFTGRIAEVCENRDIRDSTAKKIEAVTAHELLHGNNVCHHGEGDPRVEGSSDVAHGLRSGNVSCVMRYDNKGANVTGGRPEAIGSILCTSPDGTGYNANNGGFGNAARNRGDCKGQIRISGKGRAPRSCGNR
jgi:hypothetical protein